MTFDRKDRRGREEEFYKGFLQREKKQTNMKRERRERREKRGG